MTAARWRRYDPDAVGTMADRAVVVGASVAGLCAARILADAFEEVIVLERDSLPDAAVARDGAAQTGHPHILLEAGRAALEDLFPGFSEDLAAAGGLIVDGATDLIYHARGDALADGPERLPMYCASRPLIERVVRRRALACDAISLRERHTVTDYLTDGAGAVSGVVCVDDEGEETPLDATLVADATGRTSRTPEWLADRGYPAPPVDEVGIGATYGTVRVERPPGDRRVLSVPPSPPRTRGGAAIPVEGGHWEVGLQGIHGDDVPTDRAGFEAFAESLPLDSLARMVTDRPWVSDGVDAYPFPSSLRRRYERLDRFPDGLVVTGDALASFNPIYGQGMSVAALDAVQLHRALARGGRRDLGPRFFDLAGEVVDPVWQLAVGGDFAFPRTTGPKPPGTDLFNWYLDRLLRRAHADGVLRDAFFRVFRLERPPTSLLRPAILARVLLPFGPS